MSKKIFNKLVLVMLAQILIYCMLFLVVPFFLVKGVADWIWISVDFILVVAVSSWMIYWHVWEVGYWLVGIIMLWAAIMLYHPQDLYGIGGNGRGLDFFPAQIDALGFAAGVFLLQCGIRLLKPIKQIVINRKV
ncbi:hypothetical protein [Anaeromicropila populeti]|uniref:Uncharacterized protein n=1 Tax=Anaeromicropila populeti TaxID=37658 RepID=A0A1I6IYE7_9FIRM|nr:hypothetical protein [Anaeromicropila populeti]SFR71776.1 hypothetical protein SAMN05661086_01255 [Anaeromicropila populeti]